jgi:signal transduction histidine kinase
MSKKVYHILIVADSPEDRETYRCLLTAQNPRQYVIRETELGKEGLNLCRAETPDCILLDYRLPDMDGLEFVGELKAQSNQSLPAIVMLSGQGSADVAVQAMKGGVQDYLVKDALTAEGLRRAVHNAMDKVALENKIEEQRRELEALAAERARLIAELQQRASALTEVDRRKDEFLAMLAHELRNPLAPIVNALYLLRQVKTNPSAAEGALAMVERQVQRITRLVDDLLDMARITSGKIILQKKPVDLAGVVESAVETSRPWLNERLHHFSVSLPTEPVRLEADPVRLEQIICNLLNNAAKYTEPGGQIQLSAELIREDGKPTEVVALRVRDNGMGIPPDMLDRIFGLFTQVSRSLASTSQWGLGIGLTLVRNLVEMHRGTVQAMSAGPGQGSEFVVRLPLLQESAIEKGRALQSTPVAASHARPGSRAVLVVEDSTDLAESMALLLGLWGYDVRVAHSGPAALAAVSDHPPDVVLLDIGLPEMNGYQVAEALRQRTETKNVMLVALTGYGQEGDRRRALEAGFNCHLTKPVDPQALREMLDSCEAITG